MTCQIWLPDSIHDGLEQKYLGDKCERKGGLSWTHSSHTRGGASTCHAVARASVASAPGWRHRQEQRMHEALPGTAFACSSLSNPQVRNSNVLQQRARAYSSQRILGALLPDALAIRHPSSWSWCSCDVLSTLSRFSATQPIHQLRGGALNGHGPT